MDTATKRLTAANVSMPWRGIGPVPDGTIDAGDRMGYANFYALGGGDPPSTPAGYICLANVQAKIARAKLTAKIARSKLTATDNCP